MHKKARWWLLFATFPLSAVLLWLDSQFPLLPQGHQFLELGIVGVNFGLMAWWVNANRTAVAEESTRYIRYDPKCDEALDLSDNHMQADIAERTLIDLRNN